MELGKIKTKRFADGEVYVQIQVGRRAGRFASSRSDDKHPSSNSMCTRGKPLS
jgi:hypothetical protein